MENATNMTILEIGRKAVENFTPTPFADVDRRLREATKRTGEDIARALVEEADRLRREYA